MSGKVERCGYQVWHSTDETGDAFTFARHLMLIKREGMCTYIPKEIYLDMEVLHGSAVRSGVGSSAQERVG